MRERRTVQRSIFDQFVEHEIGQELKAISEWLDDHRQVLDWVEADLPRTGEEQTRCSSNTDNSVIKSWHFTYRTRLRFRPLRVCRGGGSRRNRRCSKTSVRSRT